MRKPLRYFLLLATLATCVCLLATILALYTVGLWQGRGSWSRSFGKDSYVGVTASGGGTTFDYNEHTFRLPISYWGLVLLGLSTPVLLCMVAAGALARPLFHCKHPDPTLPLEDSP